MPRLPTSVRRTTTLVIPGRGPRVPAYPAVVAMVRRFSPPARRPVAAICHGAQLLAGADVAQGRSCSTYPACRCEVERAGAADIAIDGAHTQGNLVQRPGLARPPGVDGAVPGPARHPGHHRKTTSEGGGERRRINTGLPGRPGLPGLTPSHTVGMLARATTSRSRPCARSLSALIRICTKAAHARCACTAWPPASASKTCSGMCLRPSPGVMV